MAAKGYCVDADVAAFLGQTFTTGQLAYAAARVEAAEELIDNYTHRGWLMGVQTGERHELNEFWRGDLYLKYAPLATVELVTGRGALGGADTTLVADVDYEVVDLDDGLIRLAFLNRFGGFGTIKPPQATLRYAYERILVNYTPVNTVPATIRDAAAELVAWWMQPSLRPDTYGLFSVGMPDLNMRFAFHEADALPPGVTSKLDQYAYHVTK